MNKKYLYLILFTLLALASCKTKTSDKRTVSVSILPQKYFVERIAGDYLKVNVMIPPGMSPATCEFNSEQLKQLYDSDICFTVGYLPFEITHIYPVLKNLSNLQLVNHSKDIELLQGSCGHAHGSAETDHHHEGGVDPHIWLSPRYAKEMAQTILSVLSEKYPEQQETFNANYEKLAADIDNIAERAKDILENKQHKSFLIYHPALTYFAQDYGMEQIAIEHEGKEPNPAHLKKIIDTVKEKDVHIIFIQSQFDINNAKSVAAETGATVIQIDPLNEDWLQEMKSLLEILDKNLN